MSSLSRKEKTMSVPIPLKRESGQSAKLELTIEEIIAHTKKILEIKEKAMVEGVHYGIIPGYAKPSLWKPGAEVLCKGFRLEPEFETSLVEDWERTIKWEKKDLQGKRVLEEGTTKGYIEYDTKCSLIHIPTGEIWARRVSGSCNSFEFKYRDLNPSDIRNTLEKMAEKRGLVGAVLIGVGASDVFTQDLEDLPDLLYNSPSNGHKPPPQQKPDNGQVRFATEKQVNFLKDQTKKQGITEKDFFDHWEKEFKTWDQIPFDQVNSILDWIREKRPRKK
jgi:hypothetical protein